MGPKINPNVTDPNTRIGPARETLKQVDSKVVEKAMQNMVGDLAKAGPLIMAHFKNCWEFLSALGAVGVRTADTEGKTLPAQVEDPRKFLESHFLSRDTAFDPNFKFIGPLLNNLGEAASKGWFTNKQVEAIRAIFAYQAAGKVENPTQAASAGSGGSSQRDMQDGNHDQESQEYQAFYEEMGGVEGGSSQQGGSRLMNFTSGPGGVPPGGAPAGGTQRGGSRLMSFTGPGAGGGAGGGGTGAPGGGYAPPPPPPPPSGGMGGGTGGNPYTSAFGGLPGMMQENEFLNANFGSGDPFYGLFQNLFGSENWYRNFSANATMNIQTIRNTKQQILMELAQINPNSVDGAKKMQILQARLGDAQSNERQYYDQISMAMKANNERKEFAKTIMDLVFQAGSAAIRNIAR